MKQKIAVAVAVAMILALAIATAFADALLDQLQLETDLQIIEQVIRDQNRIISLDGRRSDPAIARAAEEALRNIHKISWCVQLWPEGGQERAACMR